MDRVEAHLLPPKQRALATTGVMLAMFLSIFSQTIVATAMPRIIADLGGFDRYTQPATAYLVATAVAVPIVGRLSDIYGRRVFLMLGLVIFTLCSIPAGLSQSMNQLVACRLLQGIGGGLITASSFAAAADLFPPQGRGRFEAYAGLTSGIAAVSGPLLGGFIADQFGWRWIFLLNVPVGLAVLGVVLSHRLSTRLDETLSESVKAALPPARLDAIKNDPRALVDPVAAEVLMAGLKDIGPGGARMGDTLLGSLNAALAGAVGDVFVLSTGLVVLSLMAAMFLRTPAHARRAVQSSGPQNQ